jgi:transglutaminase-like putative cysteine protease
MQEFFLEYFIESKYESPVKKANLQLLVIPESNPQTNVLELKFQCSESQELFSSRNIFGFEILNLYIGAPFKEFWFRLTARVQKEEFNPFIVSRLSPEAECQLINSLDFKIDQWLFLQPTALTRLPPEFIGIFPEYAGKNQLFDYLLELNNFINQLLEYSPESTDVNTPIEKILAFRQGVCQDYAHLFTAVCRQNKIPARYVSGYLNQGVGFIGTSQLHAWAEALIPETGWIGFDATNNLLADHHYIKIAHGTDFNDCSPIIGVLESAGMQQSIHAVTVTNQ